jgi:hypothetical protein
MHSFATGSCQGVGRHSQPTGLVERNTKIIVLRLPCNLTATIQQPEATRHASARPSEHNNASLVRGQVDFHIKNCVMQGCKPGNANISYVTAVGARFSLQLLLAQSNLLKKMHSS